MPASLLVSHPLCRYVAHWPSLADLSVLWLAPGVRTCVHAHAISASRPLTLRSFLLLPQSEFWDRLAEVLNRPEMLDSDRERQLSGAMVKHRWDYLVRLTRAFTWALDRERWPCTTLRYNRAGGGRLEGSDDDWRRLREDIANRERADMVHQAAFAFYEEMRAVGGGQYTLRTADHNDLASVASGQAGSEDGSAPDRPRKRRRRSTRNTTETQLHPDNYDSDEELMVRGSERKRSSAAPPFLEHARTDTHPGTTGYTPPLPLPSAPQPTPPALMHHHAGSSHAAAAHDPRQSSSGPARRPPLPAAIQQAPPGGLHSSVYAPPYPPHPHLIAGAYAPPPPTARYSYHVDGTTTATAATASASAPPESLYPERAASHAYTHPYLNLQQRLSNQSVEPSQASSQRGSYPAPLHPPEARLSAVGSDKPGGARDELALLLIQLARDRHAQREQFLTLMQASGHGHGSAAEVAAAAVAPGGAKTEARAARVREALRSVPPNLAPGSTVDYWLSLIFDRAQRDLMRTVALLWDPDDARNARVRICTKLSSELGVPSNTTAISSAGTPATAQPTTPADHPTRTLAPVSAGPAQ